MTKPARVGILPANPISNHITDFVLSLSAPRLTLQATKAALKTQSACAVDR